MVDQVLIAQRDAEHPLADQGGDRVLDPLGVAAVLEAAGEALDQPDRPVRRAEKQRPGVGSDRPAVEGSHHRATFDGCKTKQIRATLCRHRGSSSAYAQGFVAEELSPIQSPDAPTPGEKSGLAPTPNAIPRENDPGGLLHEVKFQPGDGFAPFNRDTFNLASTRTFTIASAGAQAYHFNLRATLRDFGTACSFFNLSFSVLFLPANGAAIGAFQEPCSLDPNDPCLRITASEPLNRFVRSFSFAAPRAGTALVSFHGSMSCDIFEASASRVVDIVTQIGTDPNVAPSINDPGGLRHAIRLLPNEDLNYDSFSLASTRAFVVPNAGTNTYYFKLATLRRDANTQCRFYNLSFSLLFT